MVYPYIPMPSVQTMNVGKHDDVSLGWPVGQCVCDVCRRAVLSSTNTPAKLLPSKLLFPPTPATPPPSPALRDTELHTIFANMTNGTFCSLLTANRNQLNQNCTICTFSISVNDGKLSKLIQARSP